MNTTDPRVDRFIERQTTWRSETEMLRSIALSAGLSEEMKWGKPCYSFEGKNIAITQGFKDQCAFMFFKGALLKDPDGLMEPPGPNSHAARRVMFSGAKDIAALEGDVRNFILQAVEAERPGHDGSQRHEPELHRTDSDGLTQHRRAALAAPRPIGGCSCEFLLERLEQAGTEDVDEPPQHRESAIGLVTEGATGNDQKRIGRDSVDHESRPDGGGADG